MTSKDVFENATIELEERIKVITEISMQFNEKKAVEFGIKFKNWILNNIPDDLLNYAVNWKSLYSDERKKAARGFVYFLAEYKKVKIKSVHFKNVFAEDEDVLSECGDKVFNFYNKFLEKDNFNDIIGYIAHEMTHLFQDVFQTSLSHEVARKGQLYYVEPIENESLYKSNPCERESDIVENIIGGNFMQEILKNNFIETFNYKN
ncbi:MAG TPA: hypothetical protein PKJ33_03375 [Alphaproteobacteria bacterium]|nr:hypothetical protein [Alphaproteobacteria bacterium]